MINEDKVIEMLLKHNNDIAGIKDYVNDRFNQLSNTLDKIVGMMKKRDEEVTLQTYRIRENTDTLEVHSKEINRIKHKIGIED